MLHIDKPAVRNALLKGNFGIERENLRITEEGRMSHTPHPFSPLCPHIARDFCENQTEINTEVTSSPEEAVEALRKYDREIRDVLKSLPEKELLWPFSNPPFIYNEEDIPIARFYGELAEKTEYRNYLSGRYGRYKMTYSGIHLNFSFAEELLAEDFAAAGTGEDFRTYKDRQYLELAEKMVAVGWIMTVLTAASPLLDSSFVEKHVPGQDIFMGLASVRCSEMGYWNSFTPILDYSSLAGYTDSIRRYLDDRFILYPSELYYPIRLKPAGKFDPDELQKGGVSHIELRMIDLNPLTDDGIEVKDFIFAHLLMVWLASMPAHHLTNLTQVLSAQNFKNAAHFDLKTVRIIFSGGYSRPATDAAMEILEAMEDFYREFPERVREVLAFEKDKILNPEKRYAWMVKERFSGSFLEKGLERARELC